MSEKLNTPLYLRNACSSASGILFVLALFLLSAATGFGQELAPKVDQSNPIIRAAQAGNIAEVTRLLDAGTSVNSCDEFGQTPILCALKSKHLDLARELMRRGFNPTLTYHSRVDGVYMEIGRGPLTLAVSEGADDIVDGLLARGLGAFSHFFSDAYPEGGNPLIAAIQSNRPEIVGKLLKSVDAPVLRDRLRKGSFQYLDPCASIEIVDMLVEGGVDVNDPSRTGPFPTALHSYSKRGWVEGVQELLILRADPTKPDSKHMLPEDVAASEKIRRILVLAALDAHLQPAPNDALDPFGQAATLPRLVNVRAAAGRFPREVFETALTASEETAIPLSKTISSKDLDAPDNRGWSLLNYALKYQYRKLASSLLDRGADVSHLAKGGSSMVAFAAKTGDVELVRRIAALGAPVDGASGGSATALTMAIKVEDGEMVAALLQLGATPVRPGMEGRENPVESSLMAAARKGSITMMHMILEAGADINEVDMWDESAFFYAVASGKTAAVLWLAEHGADYRHLTKRNTNALTLAADLGDFPMVKALVGLGLTHADAAHYAQIKAHAEIAEYLRNLPSSSRLPDAADLWNRFRVSTDDVRQYIASGGDVNYSHNCPTPLQRMAWIGDPVAVALLLDHGADPNKLGDFQGSAASMAMYNLSENKTDESVLVLLRLLVEHGVPIEGPELQWSFKANATVPIIRSLLIGTIELGYLKCAQYLLEKGANPWFSNEDTHNNAFDVLKHTLRISEDQRYQFYQILKEYGRKTLPPESIHKRPAITF